LIILSLTLLSFSSKHLILTESILEFIIYLFINSFHLNGNSTKVRKLDLLYTHESTAPKTVSCP
jgi:hypothetical protein